MIDLGQIRDIATLRNVFFGVCDTYSDVATKIVTAPGYTPEEGKLLVVKFGHEVNSWDNNNEEWMQLYMNVNGSGAMYVETYTYAYTYPDGAERYYELMGGVVQTPVYAVFTYYEFSADDKGYRLVCTSGTLGMLGEMFDRMSAMSEYSSGKQDALVSGTNIKTVNGNSLLGSGNLMLGRTVRLANATTSDGHIIVTETETYPARTFGDLFLIKFIDELPTTYSGTLYFNMMNAPVIYPNVTYHGVFLEYGTDVIQRGDTCLFLYNTGGIMWLLYNSRWGADIASKQDALPPVANNAGKVLAVNSEADGLEWVANGYTYITHNVDSESQEPLTLTCIEQTHHHITMGYDVQAFVIHVDIHNNFENVVTVDFTDRRSADLPADLIVGVFKDGQPVSRMLTSYSSCGDTAGKMVDQAPDGRLLILYYMGASKARGFNHYLLKIRAATIGDTTYGIVHATAMLCTDSSSTNT